jgi:hypothetical protein
MGGRIFINYRRGDDPGFTQALLGRLEQTFAEDQLFMDVEDIAPGQDFVEVLNEQVAQCDVLIAMIGRGWLEAVDEDGKRRLDDPEDFVRIEIESALKQKKRVIPVLVNDAKMPRLAELPDSLHPFARCNAVRLTHERFRADAQDLIKSLQNVLTEAKTARRVEQKARRDATRLKPERPGAAPLMAEVAPDEEPKHEPAPGVIGWVAGLPSGIAWYIPLGVIGVFLLGWLLPGTMFSIRLGWGILSLIYGMAGLVATGIAIHVRREAMGGAELAVYWYAAVSALAVVTVSVVAMLDLRETVPGDAISLAIAILSATALCILRRGTMRGLEASVYWLGLTMVGFWAFLPWVGKAGWIYVLSGRLTSPAGAIQAAGLLLAGLIALSAAAILLSRRTRFSGPELAVYLMGVASAFVAVALLA